MGHPCYVNRARFGMAKSLSLVYKYSGEYWLALQVTVLSLTFNFQLCTQGIAYGKAIFNLLYPTFNDDIAEERISKLG